TFIGHFENLFQITNETQSLDQLEQIAGKFALIPYENLTKIVRSNQEKDPEKRLRMPEEVLMDYTRYGTGGTCFSLTFCLRKILTHYGYECAVRMADLGRNTNNHCVVVVSFNTCEFLIDPGYLITQPLPLPETGFVVHPTRLNPVCLERDPISGGLNLSTMESDGAKHRYYLKPGNCGSDDFHQFWLDSFTWSMMNSLLITRIINDGRFYLHDRHVRWFNRTGRKTAKLRDNFDEEVALHSGISREIVFNARTILASMKHSLQQN
ncbi:arylamine N-acetyltransferase, partial [bacterium]|nr:arylamine N-acetyltransferase [bacterium]